MNDQIGKKVNHKFSLHNFSNRNREHLTYFTLENRLTCLITKLQKRKGKQIDYVFINKKWNDSALTSESYFSFEGVSTNHQIITGKIRLSLRRNMARTTTVQYDWSLLNKRDIRDKYTLTLRNKFDAQDRSETRTPNDEYDNVANANLEAAAECIPTKPIVVSHG